LDTLGFKHYWTLPIKTLR